jgi:hypothetical protein
MMVSRTEARTVDCPACGAKAGERCRGLRGRPRESNHAERAEAAAAARTPERWEEICQPRTWRELKEAKKAARAREGRAAINNLIGRRDKEAERTARQEERLARIRAARERDGVVDSTAEEWPFAG